MRDMIARLLQAGQKKQGMIHSQNEVFLRHSQKSPSHYSNQQRSRSVRRMPMRIALFLTLSLCLFSGCQKSPQPYGNFAGVDSADLVRDAVNALHSAYPPAKANFVPLHPVEDVFGLCLVESLRSAGYAVAEYAPPMKGGKPLINTGVGSGFAYTLDALREGGALRVTLHVGDETLSRLYTIQSRGEDARYIPAGFWVRREGRRYAGQ